MAAMAALVMGKCSTRWMTLRSNTEGEILLNFTSTQCELSSSHMTRDNMHCCHQVWVGGLLSI